LRPEYRPGFVQEDHRLNLIQRRKYVIFALHPVNEYMERTVWGFGVDSREKSFGQRLQFGQPGGKFDIIRKSHFCL